ncbi:DNA helicase IV [uncultured Cedecea sp.]|uniref:DNA helicase IV n=1 Tax=uncultured Cedecea sp. TaxID=988762 RepID=UPI00260F7FAC|nr:DNA helicase IV [uncultured Cedecea sp.]
MELRATSLGKHLAQHPYNRVKLLPAGVEVKGDSHEYLIPFNQLVKINCKRGLVWGELEFVLPDNKVVRLHGTEWQETRRFFTHLNHIWQSWSEEMSHVAADVLSKQQDNIQRLNSQEKWLKRRELLALQQEVRQTFAAMPLPIVRLTEFACCREALSLCQQLLDQGDAFRQQCNETYTRQMREQYAAFFEHIESAPLNPAQAQAVVNDEDSLLVLAGAGSGKTSVLVARVGWLLQQAEVAQEQILMLAFGRKAALEMEQRLADRLNTDSLSVKTFHALALHIISEGSKKVPQVSELEGDTAARQQLLIDCWQQQCREKKAMAKGWRQWLEDELNWSVPEGEYWQDKKLITRLAGKLDSWLSLIRMQGGSQAEMIATASEELKPRFTRGIKLMAPLLKCWKTTLRNAGEIDFSGLIHQAQNILDKGRFVSPWKHILVDEFQDISPQRAALLSALRKQNSHTSLYAVGDDWQAIYRFAGAQTALTSEFVQHFNAAETCMLDTTYRFNSRIGEIANQWVQQNPWQQKKALNSLVKGDKQSVNLLVDDKLESLLDKLSGYALPEQRILILARYRYLYPDCLNNAATRWPKLNIDFMTIHASKGQEADYVIVLGLQAGKEGFPAEARESVFEQVLLPQPEDFPDAEERRLLYVALTRARQRVWLLFNKQQPSSFVEGLKRLGVPVLNRP